MKLPQAPGAYSPADQASLRMLLEAEDRRNLKREGDIIATNGLRIVLVAPNGDRYALGVSDLGALTATAL